MGIEKMLRMSLLQIWFNLSGPATEDAVYSLKRKSFVCPVRLCQFVFAGDCQLKTFHNINQGGKSALLQKRKQLTSESFITGSKDEHSFLCDNDQDAEATLGNCQMPAINHPGE